MAGRIKGITIELNGDTTKLDKALSGTEKQIKSTQQQLKDVERLLKMDPGNTELIAQKQKLLAQSISETKDKLNTLKEAQNQANAAMKNQPAFEAKYAPLKKQLDETKTKLDELKEKDKIAKQQLNQGKISVEEYNKIQKELKETETEYEGLKNKAKEVEAEFSSGHMSTEQYDALQREIIETENDLKSLETQQKKTNVTLDSIGATADKIGGKASNVASAFRPVTTAVVAVGAGAAMSFKEVDTGLDTVISKTGATGKQAEGLKQVFENVYGSFPADSQEVGNAVGEINTRLGFTGDQLETSSKQFLKFAQINGTDVNTAVQLVTRAMGDAGIESSQYGTILDQLTVASQASGISIDKLTENITKYGAPMRNLGFDTQSSIAIFSQWEKAGVNTEIAFSGMKKAISNWTKEGKDAKTEFGTFIKGVQDGSISAQQALEVFGAKAGPDLVDAIQQGRFSYDDMMSTIQNSQGIVDSTFEGMDDPMKEAQVALNNLKMAFASLAEVVLPIITPIIQKISEWAQKFKELDDGTKKTIVIIAAVLAAVAPIAGIISGVCSGISALVGVIGAISAPVAIVVAAIGALIAIFVHLYNTNEDFRNKCGEIWESIKTIVSTVVDQLKNIFSAFVELFKAIWDKWGDDIMNVVSVVFSTIGPVIEGALKIIQGVIKTITSLIKGDWSGVWDGIKTILSGVWEAIKAIVTGALNLLKASIQGSLNAIKGVFSSIWDGIKSVVSNVINGIKSTISNGMNAAKNSITGVLNGIKSAFSSVWNGVTSVVSGAINKIKSIMHFNWSLPKLKLPHISISGGFSINPPKVPHFGISWYKQGGILDGAQIFGQAGGNLLGGGEAGKEAVLPLTQFYSKLESILDSRMGTNDSMIQVNVANYLDKKEISSTLVDTTINKINRTQKNQLKAVGV